MESNNKNKNGFTLIELVITITIMGILSLVASGILIIGTDSFIFICTHSLSTREVQDAFNILHDNIINANSNSINTARNNRFYFINMNGDEVQFQYDRRNGYLRYRVVGQNDWHEILKNIQRNKFSFSYYTSNGSYWNNSEALKRVSIEVTLDLPDGNASYQKNIYIRN